MTGHFFRFKIFEIKNVDITNTDSASFRVSFGLKSAKFDRAKTELSKIFTETQNFQDSHKILTANLDFYHHQKFGILTEIFVLHALLYFLFLVEIIDERVCEPVSVCGRSPNDHDDHENDTEQEVPETVP